MIVTCRSCTGLFLSEWVSLGDPVTVARLDRWNVVVVDVIVVVVLGDRVGRGHSVTVRCLRNVCSFQDLKLIIVNVLPGRPQCKLKQGQLLAIRKIHLIISVSLGFV